MPDLIEEKFKALVERDSASPPPALIDESRRLAGGFGSSRRHERRKLLALAASFVVVAVALSLTPPGRAATGWVARLAGVGEEPTLGQRDAVPGSAFVLDSGTLADGSRYELVAKHVTDRSSGGSGPPGTSVPDSLCFQLEFPDAKLGGAGGGCSTAFRTGRFNPVISAGVQLTPGAEFGDDAEAGVFFGFLPEGVTSVEANVVDGDGVQRDLPAKLLTVDGAYLESIGGEFPVSVFLVPLDGAGASLESPNRITVNAFDEAGDLVDSRGVAFPDRPPLPEELLSKKVN